jgi:hypothetical protein
LTAILGSSSASSAGSLIADLSGQTGSTDATGSLLTELASANAAPVSIGQSSATAQPGTQQQAIMAALAGAYSQSQQNILSLLV